MDKDARIEPGEHLSLAILRAGLTDFDATPTQLWQATLAIPPAGASLAITTVPLIDSPLQLDANAFALYKL